MCDGQSSDRVQTLERSKEKFETVFEYANDAIFIVDIENDSIVNCNPAAAELVNFSREELLSMPASDLHPHNLEQFLGFAGEVIENGEGWTDDITCYCKGGDILPAEMSASVVEIDGQPHFISHVRETTDRKERDWFESLIEHSNDLITVVSPTGSIRYQSSSIDYVLGYDSDAVRDRTLYQFIHPEDEPAVRDIIKSLTGSESGAIRRLEYRFSRADGSWAWIDSVLSYRPGAPVTGVVINGRDITSKKEARQQAIVLNRMLRHNLRNGLNVIMGHAERITEANLAELGKIAEAILTKSWKLHDQSTYAKDLADMIETSSVSRRPIDVEELVKTEINTITGDYSDAVFEVNIQSDQRAIGAPKLDLAVRHVLQNAVQHNNSDQPCVMVTVGNSSLETDYVTITVADNGPGIPEQEQEVLLNGEETALRHGSGLGLWIANWIIARSGGHITFESNDPCGSRVIFRLMPEK